MIDFDNPNTFPIELRNWGNEFERMILRRVSTDKVEEWWQIEHQLQDIRIGESMLVTDFVKENMDIEIAVCHCAYPDGRLQHLPRRKPTPWLLLARQLAPKFGGAFKKADDHYTMQDEDLTAPRRIEFCTGSFMAVRTDVLQKIGGFDPAYFMYVEDADLTQKVLREGTVWLAPQFHAIHAWHRAPMRDAGKFKMQLVSMGRYFKKWGCGKGSV